MLAKLRTKVIKVIKSIYYTIRLKWLLFKYRKHDAYTYFTGSSDDGDIYNVPLDIARQLWRSSIVRTLLVDGDIDLNQLYHLKLQYNIDVEAFLAEIEKQYASSFPVIAFKEHPVWPGVVKEDLMSINVLWKDSAINWCIKVLMQVRQHYEQLQPREGLADIGKRIQAMSSERYISSEILELLVKENISSENIPRILRNTYWYLEFYKAKGSKTQLVSLSSVKSWHPDAIAIITQPHTLESLTQQEESYIKRLYQYQCAINALSADLFGQHNQENMAQFMSLKFCDLVEKLIDRKEVSVQEAIDSIEWSDERLPLKARTGFHSWGVNNFIRLKKLANPRVSLKALMSLPVDFYNRNCIGS